MTKPDDIERIIVGLKAHNRHHKSYEVNQAISALAEVKALREANEDGVILWKAMNGYDLPAETVIDAQNRIQDRLGDTHE